MGEKGDLVLRKKLDYETRREFSFRVMVTDGRENDTTLVTINVLNINDWDPRFRYPQYEFYVSDKEASAGQEVGALEVFDGDENDKISLEISGQHARVFGITEKGELFITDLSYLTGSDAHIVVTAQDSGSPPRRASVPVLVRFASSVTSPRELAREGPTSTMVIILCSVSTVFIIIILGMAGYICRYSRHSKSSSGSGSPIESSDSDSMYLQQQYPSQIGEFLVVKCWTSLLVSRSCQPQLQAGPHLSNVLQVAPLGRHEASLRHLGQVCGDDGEPGVGPSHVPAEHGEQCGDSVRERNEALQNEE